MRGNVFRAKLLGFGLKRRDQFRSFVFVGGPLFQITGAPIYLQVELQIYGCTRKKVVDPHIRGAPLLYRSTYKIEVDH